MTYLGWFIAVALAAVLLLQLGVSVVGVLLALTILILLAIIAALLALISNIWRM